jgi:hypothetical protein
MEHEVGVVWTAIADDDVERRAAIGTFGVDRAVGLERRADPERIPRAIGEPRSSDGLNAEGRGLRGERIGHLDPTRIIEYERVGIVESLPALVHRRFGYARMVRDLGGAGRPAKFHEASIGRVAQVDIGGVHGATVKVVDPVVNVYVGRYRHPSTYTRYLLTPVFGGPNTESFVPV